MKFDWNNASYLGGFAHNDKSYDHYINTKNDATYLIREDNTVMFKVDSNATMFDDLGNCLGHYRFRNGNWIFIETDETEWAYQFGEDLLKTELFLMKEFLQ